MKLSKENFKAVLKEIVETIVFVVFMVIIIRFFVGEIRWIPSASMKPTLVEGDRVFVERFSRFYSTPKRGDIMVFYPPSETLKMDAWSIFSRLSGFFCKDVAYIKRVIGLPGDKLEIKKNFSGEFTVYINEKPIKEPYIRSEFDYPKCNDEMFCTVLVIPEKQYFMMGDNRGNSQDSRYWGFLPEDRFVGRAVLLFWPFNHFDYFKKPDYHQTDTQIQN